ncbi:MAG: CvpA family protein [Patescibacteria group bacterium]|nr:CvpA family protein [Patescibacteria group bacterium]MDD5121639.1 CvpA family protein [Patescibacteria group bacterium]MDD5221907.1 CvpA family protein [Patescibacteria group bacterium]MDD5396197.1 CvpA family protein [Patescibacteria group bacterium]
MMIFDLVLLLILFGFVWFGFWLGLIHVIGGILGVIIASFLSTRWYDFVAHKLLFLFGNNLNLSRIICFIVLFIVIWRLVSLLFNFLNRVFNWLTFIPFLKTINRLAGAIFGLLEGALILGIILFFLSKFPIWGLSNMISSSTTAQFLMKIAKILWPLLPLGLKKLQEIK